ncbi:peroxidase 6 [Nicotiana tabacum]|uniref:Peroxidase n=2 Tax=Nicotiana TaxID=4085 RepID=A0A1S3ZHC9_TOBAC|nr:PREDICTED: peroxidase 6 [Nicotiana sylvestris]XP_016463784.1 PREDICTED: peroxidase 6-like [Nicotiana tabacum]
MALPLLSTFLFSSLALFSLTESKLNVDYYNKSCPQFEKIIQQIVVDKQLAAPTTAAGTLRLFFHDCMVGGCDASLLISSNSFATAERDTDINLSLPGDAFDLIARAKTALELQCPGIVSCADVLAVATRDLITMVGGPFYNIRLGRKDSFESYAKDVEGHIARPNMTMDTIINMFASKNLNIQEMVALVGAHTIGFSHCSEFSKRIFKYSNTSEIDPSMNPTFAQALRKLCGNNSKDMAAFNDVMTPGKFDNMYYINLQKGLGLLASDQAMVSDPRTKPFVELYATDQDAFFKAFAHAIEKVSVYHVKTGKKGEVRRRCDVVNHLQVNSNKKIAS